MESTPVSEKSSVPATRSARHPCSQLQAFAGARPAEQTREYSVSVLARKRNGSDQSTKEKSGSLQTEKQPSSRSITII